jgi:monoamine oxidase
MPAAACEQSVHSLPNNMENWGVSSSTATKFLDPGFDPAWRSLLGRRAGRIVFAGEHTSERWQGYMNGAVESGHRAARELLHDLGR